MTDYNTKLIPDANSTSSYRLEMMEMIPVPQPMPVVPAMKYTYSISSADRFTTTKWNTDMSKAPKDRPILGYCVHEADPYHLGSGKLTLYGGHAEGLSHVEDGPNVLVWGGAWDDSTWEYQGGNMPDWWFLKGSEFECTANPIAWIDIPLING